MHLRLLPLLATALLFAAPALAQNVAIQNARVIPVEGPELAEGTVVIQDGKIVAVGKSPEIPYDATVIEGTGKVVFPGMVLAHTNRGLDIANENVPVGAFLDVYDSINPASLVYEDALRDGVTAINVCQGNNTVIGGVGRVVRPLGLTVDTMTIRAPSAIKLSAYGMRGYDRLRQRATLREAFAELADYLEVVAEKRYAEEEEKAGREVKVPPAKARELGRPLVQASDLDAQHKNLYLLTQGQLDAFFYCDRAQDVGFAIAFAREHGFFGRTTFLLGGECVKAVDELKAAGRPVILPVSLTWREQNPVTGKVDETFVPTAFAEAGIPFAFQTNPSASFAERFLWYQAAQCVRHGIDRETAIAAMTTTAARIAGVADRKGSLAPGKDGDVLILSGDPLSAKTHVETVLIGGRVVYEREQDFRLRKLLTGEGDPTGEEMPHDDHPPHDEDPGPEVPTPGGEGGD